MKNHSLPQPQLFVQGGVMIDLALLLFMKVVVLVLVEVLTWGVRPYTVGAVPGGRQRLDNVPSAI